MTLSSESSVATRNTTSNLTAKGPFAATSGTRHLGRRGCATPSWQIKRPSWTFSGPDAGTRIAELDAAGRRWCAFAATSSSFSRCWADPIPAILDERGSPSGHLGTLEATSPADADVFVEDNPFNNGGAAAENVPTPFPDTRQEQRIKDRVPPAKSRQKTGRDECQV